NRVIYIFTDLRQRDWESRNAISPSPSGATSAEGLLQRLTRLAKPLQGCFLIDAADDDDRNLTIAEISPEGTLVQGVQSAFDVAVMNQGTTAASDVRLKFSAGEALPLEATIDRLAAGETTSVRFNFTFSGDDQSDEVARSLAPRQVKVELQTAEQSTADR